MKDSEMMLAAIANGDDADTTVSAALDALREQNEVSLLVAVLEVARVWKAARDSRDMAEATKHLAVGSPVRTDLTRSILSECPNVPAGADALILVVDGDRWPNASREPARVSRRPGQTYSVAVGALWVKREASRLIQEREQRRNRFRGRRSG